MTHYGSAAKQVLLDNCPDFLDISNGRQVSVNHTTCPAGEDVRERLGVKNVGGAFLWHCFNCGESGYYRPKEHFTSLLETGEVEVHKAKDAQYDVHYFNFSDKWEDFPTEQKLWLMSYGIDEHLARSLGIRTTATGVVLPTYNSRNAGYPGSIGGYQIRCFTGKQKYQTFTSDKYSMLRSVLRGPDGMTMVICEDLMSSYKCFLAGYNAVALMGTKLHAEMSTLPPMDRVVLWLDADTAGSSGAVALARELGAFYPTLTMVMDRQPKDFSITQIREHVDGV
jgi:hypothetical protein